MPLLSFLGTWWIEDDGQLPMEDAIILHRGRRRVRVVRSRLAETRTYRLHTDGADSRARDPHGSRLWEVPQLGDPSAIDDWMNYGTTIEYDHDAGSVDLTVTARKLPADWEELYPVEEEDVPQ